MRQPVLAAAFSLGAGWAPASSAAAQPRGFKLQTPTALPSSPPEWTFLALADGDVAAVKSRGTNSKVEIQIAAAASRFQRVSVHTDTAMPSVDDEFLFIALPDRDIAAVRRNGDGGRTELHVLDAGKAYKAYRLQTPTALPATDRRWSFGADGDGNLVGINRLGESGKTEIHVVDARQKYRRFKLQAESALHATDSSWDFGVLANGDVLGINRRGDSGQTELHLLDAAKDYKRFKLQAPSPLAAADDAWKFAVRGNGEVMAVLTRGSASGKTELHVFDSVKP